MGGLITLLSLCTVMAVASFLAGTLPLSISLSRSQLRLISTIGMGVLVGTSMIVIIPEGVETLYKYDTGGHSDHVRRSANSQHLSHRWAHTALPSLSIHSVRNQYESRDLPAADAFHLPGPVIPDSIDEPPKTPSDPGKVGILDNEEDNHENRKQDADHKEEAHHAWIGIALISGFILMFLIDRLPQLTATPKPQRKTQGIALNIIGRRFNLSSSPHDDSHEESDVFIEGTPSSSQPSKRSSATTIGLIIHAAADGIALGASSSSEHTSLSLIIFFAIMLHKAPAAFGLTSILLRQGLSKRTARMHLILFSLAAPIGAVLTWMAARILGSGISQNASNTKWWTGILLLFSAGTFLYVAMHSMQEILDGRSNKSDAHGHVNGTFERRDSVTSGVDQHDEQKPSLMDLGAAIFGMILPLFLQVGHAH